MARASYLLFIMSGLILVFYLFGLLDNTVTSALLDLVINPSNINSSLTQLILTGVGGLGVIGTVIIGFVTKDIQLTVFSGVSFYLLSLLYDILVIANALSQTSPVLGLVIFSPLALLWGITAMEWWRGTA